MAANKDFLGALERFESVVARSADDDKSLTASREAAKILFYEIKDFQKAVQFYQKLVLASKDPQERLFAQKQIVAIFFDHSVDFQRAIIEINRLIPMTANAAERSDYKIKLARAYYYQNNFAQAENEVDELLKTNPSGDKSFEVTFLKGNIALAKKEYPRAIEIFKSLIGQDVQRAVKENVVLTLSVCYEELKDFKMAIETLLSVRDKYTNPEYVDIRIQRLKERLGNQPGARGRVRK